MPTAKAEILDDDILVKLKLAEEVVFQLCRDPASFRMSIPVQHSDTDRVLHDALLSARLEITGLRALLSCQALTFRELIAANLSRVARWHSLESWSALEWAGAMAGEAGEACNAAKKLKRVEDGIANHSEDPTRALADKETASRAVALEIADTVIYGVLLAARVGVDLEGSIREAFNRKSEQYGFPERI